jgi:uncharacterized delta-60 repeat protein
VAAVGPAQAAPGQLDPSFGIGGKVVTSIGPNSWAAALALQPDGKLVAFGSALVGTDYRWALARYTPSGALDPSFGQGGEVTTPISGVGEAVALQPDGKILVTGGSGTGLGLARYLPDGSPDPSFGSGGAVVSSFPGSAYALALEPDGKIVVGGSDYMFTSFALARFLPDGAVDTGFGNGGEVTTRLDPIWGSQVTSLAVQTDGRIVAAGLVTAGEGGWPALARYNADGSLDATFGSGGKVTEQNTALDPGEVNSVRLDSSGKIVVVGRFGADLNPFAQQFSLFRLRTDGSFDPSFGTSSPGITLTPVGWPATASAVVLQRDGKIVLAGTGGGSFALARYGPTGRLDNTFGNRGIVKTGFGTRSAAAGGLVVQRDGKLVAAGVVNDDLGRSIGFALARYLGSSICRVPDVRRRPLAAARRTIVSADCSVGRVTRVFSSTVRKGRVVSQRPLPGTRRPEHAKVRLVLSAGRPKTPKPA